MSDILKKWKCGAGLDGSIFTALLSFNGAARLRASTALGPYEIAGNGKRGSKQLWNS